MAIALRDKASAASTAAGTSASLTIPSTFQVGDLMLVQVASRSGSSQTYTLAGWNSIRRDNSGASTGSSQLYWKQCQAGDPGSTLTVTLGTSANWAIGIVGYSGADTTTAVDVHGGQANASSTSVAAPSITSTAANDQLLFFGAAFAADTFSPPTSPGTFTEQYDVKSTDASSNIGIEGADLAWPTAGSTGTVTATASPTAAANTGQLVAVLAAAATNTPRGVTVIEADLPWFAEV